MKVAPGASVPLVKCGTIMKQESCGTDEDSMCGSKEGL